MIQLINNTFIENLIPTKSEIKSIIYSIFGFIIINFAKNFWNKNQAKKSFISNRNSRLASSLNTFIITYDFVYENSREFVTTDLFMLQVFRKEDDPKIKSLKQIKIQLESIGTYISSIIHEFDGEVKKYLNEISKGLKKLAINNLENQNDVYKFVESGNKAYNLAKDIEDHISRHPNDDLRKYIYNTKLTMPSEKQNT